MTAATRTDIHRPSAAEFDPEAYDLRGVFDLNPEMPYGMGENLRRVEAVNVALAQGLSFHGNPHGMGQCSHCGAHIRYAALMAHRTSGTLVWIGETCLDNRFSLTQRDFHSLRESARLNRDRIKRSEKIEQVLAAMDAGTRAAYDWALTDGGETARDIAGKVERYTEPLSEKQAAFLVKLHGEAQERAARAQREADLLAAGELTPCPTGRVVITGEVKSMKLIENDFGSTLKMLVADDAGFRVWGSCPRALDCEVGSRVTFTATVEPKASEPLFGFFSRPSKAQVL